MKTAESAGEKDGNEEGTGWRALLVDLNLRDLEEMGHEDLDWEILEREEEHHHHQAPWTPQQLEEDSTNRRQPHQSWTKTLWSKCQNGLRSTWNRASFVSKSCPVHWFWVDDSGSQVAYGPKEEQVLEWAWGQGQMEVKVVMRGQTYCIDLAAPGSTSLCPDIPVGFQTNILTGKRRAIFRVVGGLPSSPTNTTHHHNESLSSSSALTTQPSSRSECRALIPYQPSFSMITALFRVLSMFRAYTRAPTQEELLSLFACASERVKEGVDIIKFIMSYQAREFLRPFCKTLNPESQEYQRVAKLFRKTVSRNIVSIERIQNDRVLNEHKAKHKSMNAEYGYNLRQHGANPLELFHGLDAKDEMCLKNICYNGFNRSYFGKNGTVYGKGCYFARDASYSLSYCKEGPDGLRKMILASVLVGDYAVGSHDLLEPPLKQLIRRVHDLPVRYDTVVDRMDDPSIFVTFYDASACPLYVITFK